MSPASTASAQAAFNSSTELMHRRSVPSSVDQMGMGMPQNRERLRFQSFRFSNHFPNRPDPVLAGFQRMVLFSSCMRSLAAVARMNQLSSG